MPRSDHFLVDPVQNIRGEQPEVVLEGLEFVGGFIGPVTVAEHLAQGAVLVGQLLDPVVVGIEPQSQHAQHQDGPLRHPGTTGIGVGFAAFAFRQDLFEDGEDPLTHHRGGVEVLQAPQQLRDIVAGFRVKADSTDGLFPQPHLRLDYFAHGIFI